MTRIEAERKARELVSKMSVEEAASQLLYDSPEIKRLGVPAYNWWNESLHGVARAGTATVFPQAIAMAATFDRDLMRKEGEVSATEGRAKYNAASSHGDRDIYKGLTFWSPNINIFRDPRWGRGHETLGEDPYLTAEMGKEFVLGLQGDGEHMKAAACAKHYAVHSGPESLRHEFNAVVSSKDLEETYLPAFKVLVQDAKVEAVMGAYNRTLGEPCCGSSFLIQKKLREEWGFKGHYVSDCWAIRDFHEHHKVTDSPAASAAKALKAGCDVNCGCTYRYIMEAYSKGLVTKKEIKESAVRLFTTRYLLGIMEGSEYDSIPITEVEKPLHIHLSKKAALESAVLLKNNGILPLKKEKLRTLAVIGPNADSRIALKGNYYGTSSRNVTVLEGLRKEFGEEVRILYAEGCDLKKEKTEPLAREEDRIAEALAVAEAADVIIAVVGLDERLEGEEGDEGNNYASGDKADLLLPKSQRILLDKLAQIDKPLVTVLLAGSSIDLLKANEDSDAIIMGWYPGGMGGEALAEIISGKVSPSGKLPITFYKNSDLDRMPAFTDYSMKDRTYRYIPFQPLYPFGFGLTYSRFALSQLSLSEKNGERIISGYVENLGEMDASEVVQVYVENKGSRNEPLHPRLVEFMRVFVRKGKKEYFEFHIPDERLKVVDEEGRFVQEGYPLFHVGFGQDDPLSRKLGQGPSAVL